MPVSYGAFSKQMKSLPITLHADGRASVTVRFGFVGEDNVFNPATEQQFEMTAEEVSSVLDVKGIPSLTRRDDLSYCIYVHLVTTGKIPPGAIT